MELLEVPRCPHDDIRDCPLYCASHEALPGCCVGDWARGCTVASGFGNYAELVAQLRWRHRGWWREFCRHLARRQAAEQRKRNERVK